MRWRTTIAFSIVWALVLMPSLSLVASAQSVYITYALVNNTLTVETTHYRLVLDAGKGGITSMNLTNDQGGTYVLVENSSVPLLSIITDGNQLRNGKIRVVGEEKDRVLIVDVEYSLNNSKIIEKFYFYSWSPLISVNIITSNIVNNLSLNIVANIVSAENLTVKRAYVYASGDNITGRVVGPSGVHKVAGNETPISFAIIGLHKAGNATSRANISFFEGLSFRGAIGLSKFSVVTENLTGNITVYREIFTYQNVSSVDIDFMATNYAPAVLSVPPFALPLEVAASVGKDLDMIARLNKYIGDLKDRIDTLNSTIKNLRDKLNSLDKELANYKGCEDHYKQELKAKEYQLERLQERLKKTGIVEAAVFFVGILLGIGAGLYIIRR